MKKLFISHIGNCFARTEIELPSPVAEAKISVIADPHVYLREFCQKIRPDGNDGNWLVGGSFLKFRLYCDGRLIGCGPFRALEDGNRVRHTFRTGPLSAGRHAVSLIFRGEKHGISVESAELGIFADRGWKIRSADGFYRPVCYEYPNIQGYFKGDCGPGEYFEHLDGRHLPHGWQEPGFDDSKWTAPTVSEAEFVCEEADYNYTVSSRKPAACRKTADGRWIFDFGTEMIGSFAMTGGGDEFVEVRLGEEMLDDDHVRFQMRSGNCYQEMWRFQGKRQRLEHFGLRIFRYAEICGFSGEVPEVEQTTVHAPFDGTDSMMRSGIPELDRIWDLCKRTIRNCNMDLYTDCFSRERICYEADSYVAMRTDFAVSGDCRTAARSMEFIIRHQTWPAEWKQMILPMLDRYLMHTADFALLRRNWESLVEKCSFHHLMRDGLIRDFPLEHIIDWPAREAGDYDLDSGVLSIPNMLNYLDLSILGKWAAYAGGDADKFLKLAGEALEACRKNFFDPGRGLFLDGSGSRHASLHANMWALWCGVVPEGYRSSVAGFVADSGPACSLYSMQFYLEVLFRNGYADKALDIITGHSDRSWMSMIDSGLTLTAEYWEKNSSMAHPWGTSPANLIVEYLFGLKPTSPGWKSWEHRISPLLKSPRLKVKTPGGIIDIPMAGGGGRQEETTTEERV